MKDHQRYFPVRTPEGKLLPKFLTAIDRPDEHLETVRRGHENVLKARLADARFFFNEDMETPFTKKVAELKQKNKDRRANDSYPDYSRIARNYQ